MTEQDLAIYDLWEAPSGNLFLKVSNEYSVGIGSKNHHNPDSTWLNLRRSSYVKASDIVRVTKVGRLVFDPPKALILKTQDGDWEALYIDTVCVSQSNKLGEGNAQLFMLRMAEKYHFTSADVRIETLTDEDNERCDGTGSMPHELSELCGVYLPRNKEE